MRIQSVSPEGTVVEYPSIQAAGRAGFSVQRVHACIHGTAKTHRGLTWRRVDDVALLSVRHFDLPKRQALIAATDNAELPLAFVRSWINEQTDLDAAVDSLPPELAAVVEHTLTVLKQLQTMPHYAVASLYADWDKMVIDWREDGE